MTRYSLLLAALLVAAAAITARPMPLGGWLEVRVHAAAPQGAPEKPAETSGGTETAGGEHGANSGWSATIAKTVNFAILVAILVYFLRTPVSAYLTGRIGKVREDLVTAAQTRETASRRLAEIAAQLKALPLEIEALKQRGAEDIAAERARIEVEAEAERRRLLDQTRREIEMRMRVARRELLELAAELAMTVAGDRIARAITPDDQARLIDRYAAQLTPAQGPGAAGAGL